MIFAVLMSLQKNSLDCLIQFFDPSCNASMQDIYKWLPLDKEHGMVRLKCTSLVKGRKCTFCNSGNNLLICVWQTSQLAAEICHEMWVWSQHLHRGDGSTLHACNVAIFQNHRYHPIAKWLFVTVSTVCLRIPNKASCRLSWSGTIDRDKWGLHRETVRQWDWSWIVSLTVAPWELKGLCEQHGKPRPLDYHCVTYSRAQTTFHTRRGK